MSQIPQTQSAEYPNSTPLVDTNLLGNVSWRYDQSTNVLKLLQDKQAWYSTNHDQFWNNWLQSIFIMPNANTFGIAVWAIILNLPLQALALSDTFNYWAFGVLRDNFVDSTQVPPNPTGGNFPPVSATGAITTNVEKIAALRLKYYTLITPNTVTAINAMLVDVFGDLGTAWVLDNEDMTMTYVFNFTISSVFQANMVEYNLLPKPAGVKIIIQVNAPA